MALRDAGGRRRAHRAWCPSARSGTPCPARTSAAAGRGTSGSPACRRRCGRGSSCRAPRTAPSAAASWCPAHMPARLQARPATAPAMAVVVHSHAMRRFTSAALGPLRPLGNVRPLSSRPLPPVAPPEEQGARRPERGRPRAGQGSRAGRAHGPQLVLLLLDVHLVEHVLAVEVVVPARLPQVHLRHMRAARITASFGLPSRSRLPYALRAHPGP